MASVRSSGVCGRVLALRLVSEQWELCDDVFNKGDLICVAGREDVRILWEPETAPLPVRGRGSAAESTSCALKLR